MSTRIIRSIADPTNINALFNAISGKLGVDKEGVVWLCGHKVAYIDPEPSPDFATKTYVKEYVSDSLEGYALESWVLELIRSLSIPPNRQVMASGDGLLAEFEWED
jgi:hypothetical protein